MEAEDGPNCSYTTTENGGEQTTTMEPAEEDKENKKIEEGNNEEEDNNSKNAGFSASLPNFEAVSSIARGAFGTTLVARNASTGEVLVAKKIPRKYRQMAEEEGRIMKRLTLIAKGPESAFSLGAGNIVQSTETLSSERHIYIMQEYMEGGSLAALLAESRTAKSQLPDLVVLAYAQQVSAALVFVHSAAIVHRDVKPDNLLLSSDRLTLKLGDFGAARRLAPGGVLCECALLSDGTAGGTRAYTAPEVLMGLDYDHRCDVWSLGCVLYELVELGRRAFAGDHTGTDRAIINGRYEPVRRAAYGPAIAVFLQTDPHHRPAALEAHTQLGRLAASLLLLPSASAAIGEGDAADGEQQLLLDVVALLRLQQQQLEEQAEAQTAANATATVQGHAGGGGLFTGCLRPRTQR